MITPRNLLRVPSSNSYCTLIQPPVVSVASLFSMSAASLFFMDVLLGCLGLGMLLLSVSSSSWLLGCLAAWLLAGVGACLVLCTLWQAEACREAFQKKGWCCHSTKLLCMPLPARRIPKCRHMQTHADTCRQRNPKCSRRQAETDTDGQAGQHRNELAASIEVCWRPRVVTLLLVQ